MPKLSVDTGLAIGGIAITLVLVVLDKTGKLKGGVLIWLLVLAAIMTLPIALFGPLVSVVEPQWKSWIRALSAFLVIFAFWAVAIWIRTPKDGNSARDSDNPVASPKASLDETDEIKILFNEPTAEFTKDRRDRIRKIFMSVRKYLRGVGFDVPAGEVRVGTQPGSGSSLSASGGSIAGRVIVIGVGSLNDDAVIEKVYALHVFALLFDAYAPSDLRRNKIATAQVFSEYFSKEHRGDGGMSGAEQPFTQVLWQFRQKYGATVVDDALLTMQKTSGDVVDYYKELDFDEYFTARFVQALAIVDNDAVNKTTDILNAFRKVYSKPTPPVTVKHYSPPKHE